MSRNRYAKKRDDNEPEIIAALESIGCTVLRLDDIDLLVGRGAKNILLEVKNVDGRNRNTDFQNEFLANWKGQVAVVRTPEEAIEVVQNLTVKNAYP